MDVRLTPFERNTCTSPGMDTSPLLLHEQAIDDHERDLREHHDERVAHFQPRGSVLLCPLDPRMFEVRKLRDKMVA